MLDPVISAGQVTVYVGDTVQVLPLLEPGWVDAVVTDPPYGLEFAGQAWDGSAGFRESLPDLDGKGLSAGEAFQAWCAAWARGALQVLKPGGHAAVFGGTRMWHRLVAGVEQAGFEIRDQIAWLYSSGMPKSLDISYAIDQRLGEQRLDRRVVVSDSESVLGQTRQVVEKGDPVTDEAREWSGWGTGLKPGFEPIMIARKPLDGTVAANVLAYGTGGLNIDAARVDGRWPANVALDEGQAVALDAATGSLGSDDSVSARFPVFRYESKASASERPRVCGVSHVTVKPLSLMRWLVRLLTPVGGVVLEPFAGSGTTVEAAVLEGYRVVAIEKDPDFVPLIQARLERLGL